MNEEVKIRICLKHKKIIRKNEVFVKRDKNKTMIKVTKTTIRALVKMRTLNQQYSKKSLGNKLWINRYR